jgi:hypothetical protein
VVVLGFELGASYLSLYHLSHSSSLLIFVNFFSQNTECTYQAGMDLTPSLTSVHHHKVKGILIERVGSHLKFSSLIHHASYLSVVAHFTQFPSSLLKTRKAPFKPLYFQSKGKNFIHS